MKKFIVAALFVIAAPATMADESREYCTSIGTLAEMVMKYRQAGVTAMEMHSALNNAASPLTETMIEEAYKIPRFSTESYQAEVASEFVSTWFMACLRVERENRR